MAFPKRGDAIVVDTHVIVKAVQQERSGELGPEHEFIENLIARCPRIVLTVKQVNRDPEGATKGELVTRLRKECGLRMFESDLILRLDKEKKLSRASSSTVAAFPDAMRKRFHGAGHEGVTDDIHLYETAKAKAAIVVSQDESLLSRAGDLARDTSVVVMHPSDVLAGWVSEDETLA